MTTTTFSELRNNARKYFDKVEHGEVVEIYRHGKPVAILTPVKPMAASRWKTSHPAKLRGASLSAAILDERDEDGK